MDKRILIFLGCAGLSLLVVCLLIVSGWFVWQGIAGEGPLAMLATATKTPKPTRTPVPSTSTPEPTPTLSFDRDAYHVTLRATTQEVLDRYEEIKEILEAVGYEVEISDTSSVWGPIDYLAYGAPSSLDAIDDISMLIGDVLDITGIEPNRYNSNDAWYNNEAIVIEIWDLSLFVDE
ncbi:MAG: hypothetical protein FVQ83_14550 [Chloroflexi bacterium]|nr:hypothetical protein [Chloroflexota bacterium]